MYDQVQSFVQLAPEMWQPRRCQANKQCAWQTPNKLSLGAQPKAAVPRAERALPYCEQTQLQLLWWRLPKRKRDGEVGGRPLKNGAGLAKREQGKKDDSHSYELGLPWTTLTLTGAWKLGQPKLVKSGRNSLRGALCFLGWKNGMPRTGEQA